MMLLSILIIWATFLFLSKSLSLKPLPPWTSNVRLVTCWSWKEITPFPISIISTIRTFGYSLTTRFPQKLTLNSVSTLVHKTGNNQGTCNMSIMDLPNLVLECILEKLPPDELCRMASICSELRGICLSDHLWENHLRRKWGQVIGSSSCQQSLWRNAIQNHSVVYRRERPKGLLGLLLHLSPFSWIPSMYDISYKKSCSAAACTSLVSWYSLLESGKVWFPAQVYNRENGHTGFMLSCYDAELNYDRLTNTFNARYPPHGRRALVVEEGVQWERIRAAPVDTSPHDLYVSDCLEELHPGDHVEIQWRRNKDFPYGWWYGVVGHLDSCDGNEMFCHCHKRDVVVLEFNQYASASRWRRTLINRRDHKEEGYEAYGFYGGIRKITGKDEISTWKYLWPIELLE